MVYSVDCPYFQGGNVIEWLKCCYFFFEMHQVPDDFKTSHDSIQYARQISARKSFIH
jgi:hypothetical protein